jgi:four helix bundle protein
LWRCATSPAGKEVVSRQFSVFSTDATTVSALHVGLVINMQDFRNLKVWEKGHQLTLGVYRSTAGFPKDELYGLRSQIRRAAASIPANLSEACGKGERAEFAQYLRIAMGSASELEYHLLLAHDLKFLEDADYKKLAADTVEVKRMLAAFITKLKA